MSEYPRPELHALREHAGDRNWGSIICILSALSLILNAALAFGVGQLGGLWLVSPFECGLLAVRFAGGFGILSHRRWGFILEALVSTIYVVLNVCSLANVGSHFGLISLLVNAYIFIFCVKRLTGRNGPSPT